MIELARKAALFLAGLVVLLAAAQVYYEVRVRQTDDFFRQLEWFHRPDVQPVVLIVGDSRAATNVVAERLPPGFYNWSYPAETLQHMYLRVKYALRTKPSIRYLVLGLEDLTLSEPRAERRDVLRHVLFAGAKDLAEVYPGEPRLLVRSTVLHYLPLINAAERSRLGDALLEDIAWLFDGTVPEQPTRLVCGAFQFTAPHTWKSLKAEMRAEIAAAKTAELLGASNVVPEMQALFRRLLALAHAHDVQVIGLRNPVSPEYHDAAARYDPEAAIAFFADSPLYALLDFEDLFLDHPEFFHDSDHLNGSGAAAFTDHLVARLTPLVRIDDKASAPCETDADAPSLRWPYNDVLSSWLRDRWCRFDGACDRAAASVVSAPPAERDRPESPAAATPRARWQAGGAGTGGKRRRRASTADGAAPLAHGTGAP